jgi:hypothetical protein
MIKRYCDICGNLMEDHNTPVSSPDGKIVSYLSLNHQISLSINIFLEEDEKDVCMPCVVNILRDMVSERSVLNGTTAVKYPDHSDISKSSKISSIPT